MDKVSTYITASSTSCLKYFPSNRNNHFRNTIPKHIFNKPNLEAALVSISFTLLESTHTIFSEEEDRLINIITLTESIFTHPKEENLEVLVTKFNLQFIALGLNVQFLMDFGLHHPKPTIQIVNGESTTLILDEHLSNSLNSKTRYPTGRYLATQPMNKDFYATLPENQLFQVKLIKEDSSIIKVKEPEVKNEVGLVSSINDELEALGISFVYSSDPGKLTMTQEGGPITLVRLSPKMENLFGLERQTIFSTSNQAYPATSSVEVELSSKTINILTNFLQPQPFFGSVQPVLQTLISSNFKSNEEAKVRLIPLYVPVPEDLQIDYTEFTLKNEHLEPVTLSQRSPVILTIHVRTRI